MLDVFAELSWDRAVVLSVVFAYMPYYGVVDDFETPQLATYIGQGLQFTQVITNWIREGYVIASLSVSELSADAYKPVENWHPLWSGDSIDTVDGPLQGTGNRDDVDAKRPEDRRNRARKVYDYRNPPMKKKAKPRKRDSKALRARLKAQGKKKNKGDVAAQRQRRRMREKLKKLAEKGIEVK